MYRTSDIARKTNIHPNTVRFYERLGLISTVPRSSNGYRVFDHRHLAQVMVLRCIFLNEWPGEAIRKASLKIIIAMKSWDLVSAHPDEEATIWTGDATGVAVLLALAERLQQYNVPHDLELVAFNGEDYYAIPGQMLYIQQNDNNFSDVQMVINIDGTGHIDSNTALSFYNLPENSTKELLKTTGEFYTLRQGEEWYEGDHSMFLQQGVPCMAVTSSNLHEGVMNISHTPQDTLDKVNQALLEDLVDFLYLVINKDN